MKTLMIILLVLVASLSYGQMAILENGDLAIAGDATIWGVYNGIRLQDTNGNTWVYTAHTNGTLIPTLDASSPQVSRTTRVARIKAFVSGKQSLKSAAKQAKQDYVAASTQAQKNAAFADMLTAIYDYLMENE